MEKSRAIELLKLAVPTKALTQQEYADFVEAVNMGMDALEQPTIQPEVRTGKWTLGFDNKYMEKYYYCSCCGGRKYGEHEPLDYFCPNCGARMKGAEHEID